MRKIERLIVLLLSIAIPAMAIFPRYPVWLRVVALLAASMVPLHAWAEGLHWQMLPACAAALMLPLAFAMTSANRVANVAIAATAAVLVLLSIVSSWALPMFELPQPSGKYPVGTRTIFLTDLNRMEMHAHAPPGNHREVAVQLWYPSATAKGKKAMYRRWKETQPRSSYQAALKTHSLQDAPMVSMEFPVLVFNHGWHGLRQRTTFMAQELASHGFVVAAISHSYNSGVVELTNGRLARYDPKLDIGFALDHYIPLRKRLEIAEWELRVQADDCRFVLDELERMNRTPGDPLESRLLPGCTGTYGHSFGGAVSAEFAREDPRVRSVLGLDCMLHGAVAKQGLNKPLMMIDSDWFISFKGNSDDDDPLAAETFQMWRKIADVKTWMLLTCGGVRVILYGTNHANFLDVGFMSPLKRLTRIGSLDQARAAWIINAYTVDFFKQTLLGEFSPLLSGHNRDFPEAKVEIWPAPAVKT